MFPYSLGVQAATKAKAKADLIVQVEALVENHPDEAEKFGAHLDAVVGTAGLLIDLLPDDIEGMDVAVSAAGHLAAKKNTEGKREAQAASVHVSADRRPADPSKYLKDVKSEAKPEAEKANPAPVAKPAPKSGAK